MEDEILLLLSIEVVVAEKIVLFKSVSGLLPLPFALEFFFSIALTRGLVNMEDDAERTRNNLVITCRTRAQISKRGTQKNKGS